MGNISTANSVKFYNFTTLLNYTDVSYKKWIKQKKANHDGVRPAKSLENGVKS